MSEKPGVSNHIINCGKPSMFKERIQRLVLASLSFRCEIDMSLWRLRFLNLLGVLCRLDFQVRLGLLDDPTAPALDVSWQRVRRQFEEGKSKVRSSKTGQYTKCLTFLFPSA